MTSGDLEHRPVLFKDPKRIRLQQPNPVYWNAQISPLQVPWDCLGYERCKACLTMMKYCGQWLGLEERRRKECDIGIIKSFHSKIRFDNIWPDDLFLAVILRIECFWMQSPSIMHLGHYATPVKELGVLGRNSNWIDAYQERAHFCCPMGEFNSSDRPVRGMWAYIRHTDVDTPYLWSATFTSPVQFSSHCMSYAMEISLQNGSKTLLYFTGWQPHLQKRWKRVQAGSV